MQLEDALSHASLLWHLHATRAAGWFSSSPWVSGRTRQTSCAEQQAIALILYFQLSFLDLIDAVRGKETYFDHIILSILF